MGKLLDMIRSEIPLQRRGSRWSGRCPFHADKRPSFAVWTHKGEEFWGCWGCGKRGGAVLWIAETRGVSTTEAWRILNERQIRLDPEVLARRRYEQRCEAYRQRILSGYRDRHPDAGIEEIAFIAALSNERLVEWVTRL